MSNYQTIDNPHGYNWFTKSRLGEDGFELLLKVNELIELSKVYKSDGHLIFDFSDNRYLKVWLKDKGAQKKLFQTPYGSKVSKLVFYTIYISIKRGWVEEPVDKDEFKLLVAKKDNNLNRRDVRNFLNRNYINDMFEVTDKTVRLKFIPDEILLEKFI